MNAIQSLAHDVGHHLEKLANDGIDGWGMDPKEVIEQIWTLGSILEELAKSQSIEKLNWIHLEFILDNVVMEVEETDRIKEVLSKNKEYAIIQEARNEK